MNSEKVLKPREYRPSLGTPERKKKKKKYRKSKYRNSKKQTSYTKWRIKPFPHSYCSPEQDSKRNIQVDFIEH